MGDTTLAGTGGGAHAVEEYRTHGSAHAVHRRPPARDPDDHGALRSVWRLPQDGLQMDRPLPAPRARRPGGALAPSPSRPESDRRRDRRRNPGGSPSTPRLGREEAAGTPPAAAPAGNPPGPPTGLRHPASARARHHARPAPPPTPSRRAPHDHRRPHRRLA